VDFVPTKKMACNIDIVAQPHAKYLKDNKVYCYYEQFWRESYSAKEGNLFRQHHPETSEKICLTVVKAVRMNKKHLGIFHSFIFKTVMLSMIDDEHLTEDKLQ
jgi:hypothetical protein